MTDLLHQDTGVHVDLDGGSLTIAEAVRLARHGGTATLSTAAARRVEAARALKHDLIDREIPIYGVTTGFGDSAHRQIAPEKAAALQQNMLRFLGAGTGQIASPEVTRATMLFRANCLAKGNSGVRRELIEGLLTLLNHDILPLIPERGSCGASGDLVPLSYVGRALAGETEVLYNGEVREAEDVLHELGLEPMTLESKEGLALTNGTSFMSAFAVHVVHDARELAFVMDLCTAMASQALMGNHGHFNSFLFEAKPHPGIIESAANVRTLLDGSLLTHDAEEIVPLDGLGFRELTRSVQDKYSVRCAPHINGALRDTLEWVERWVAIEINSSDDNPLFDVAAGRVQSGGNFYGSPHDAGHGRAEDRARQPVRPDRPSARARRRREVQRGAHPEPDSVLRAHRS